MDCMFLLRPDGRRRAIGVLGLAALSALAQPSLAQAQPPAPQAPAVAPPAQPVAPQADTLAAAFAQAWSRQPEALASQARRDAAQAAQAAAQRWTPEPPALEVAHKTDRLASNEGVREVEAGLALPLWLPGERRLTAAQADAERTALDSRLQAARWRFAGPLRDAWWALQSAGLEQEATQGRVQHATQLAADVARRVAAGDLSRADQNQADGALAQAQADAAEAAAAVIVARQALLALGVPAAAQADAAEPMPAAGAVDVPDAAHPALLELDDRALLARRTQDLAAAQKRGNPELALLATRERGGGEPSAHRLTIGLRVPLGSAAGHRAKVLAAGADRIEAEQQRLLEAERLAAEIRAARALVDAAQAVVAAADRRAELARQTRGYVDKSFRLGETDLPNRLRIELDAFDAERQSGRARIAVAQAISRWRQALGLLPQ